MVQGRSWADAAAEHVGSGLARDEAERVRSRAPCVEWDSEVESHLQSDSHEDYKHGQAKRERPARLSSRHGAGRIALSSIILLGVAVGAAGNVSPAFSDSAALLSSKGSGGPKSGANMHTTALQRETLSMMSTTGKFKKAGGSGGSERRNLPPPLLATRGPAGASATAVESQAAEASAATKTSTSGTKQQQEGVDALLQQLRIETAAPPGLRSGAAGLDLDASPTVVFEHESSEDVAISHSIINTWGSAASAPADKAKPASGYALTSGHSIIPHPLKAYRGGEDVAMEVTCGGHTVIAVFDGVGGWADLGIDPALYARRLAELVRVSFESDPSMCLREQKPLLTMLQAAHKELEIAELPGSCTACLALFTSDGKLHVLNIGDSGIHLVRDGRSIFHTAEQQHFFNCPFQLGMGSDDYPTDGDYYVLDNVLPGDTIVAATDGTWDNVFVDDVVDAVSAGGSESDIAERIARRSHEQGGDPSYMSPFATNAAAQGLRYFGGKLDDVTVVVSRVVGAAGGGVGGGERVLSVAGLNDSPVSSMDSADA